MSPDELIVLIVAGIGVFGLWGSWLHQHAFVGRDGYPRARGTYHLVVPLVCAGLLFLVLKTSASFDVVDSPLYLTFYMVVGAAWVGVCLKCTGVAGISVRDDVIERRNRAAAIAVGGAMVGFTLTFAGGNIGDGPGWWVVLFSSGLATATLFALWVALDIGGGAADSITVERDVAAGTRVAGFLIGQGLILGRSVAGDWISAAATVRDFATTAWPALVLLAFAILVERSFRPSPQRPNPPVPAFGLFPAVAYLIAGAAVVLRLETLP